MMIKSVTFAAEMSPAMAGWGHWGGGRVGLSVAGTCGGGWSIAETTSAGLFSGSSSSTGILSCRARVAYIPLKPSGNPLEVRRLRLPARISPARV